MYRMLVRGSSRDLLPLYFPTLYIFICLLLPIHFAYVHGAICLVIVLRPLHRTRLTRVDVTNNSCYVVWGEDCDFSFCLHIQKIGFMTMIYLTVWKKILNVYDPICKFGFGKNMTLRSWLLDFIFYLIWLLLYL